MGKIKVTNCDDIEGLKVIEPTVFGDSRGYFMETYNYNDFKEAGIDVEFVQDNQSSSRYGVLRGLHFQLHYPQDKLVRVVNGEVFDVAVDLSIYSLLSVKFLKAAPFLILVREDQLHTFRNRPLYIDVRIIPDQTVNLTEYKMKDK